MDLNLLIAGLTKTYQEYQEAIDDKKITVGEFQEIIKTASDVALDVFDVRDKVLISLEKETG